jgi:phosphatidylserine decarboxylase
MKFRPEVLPFLMAAVGAAALMALGLRLAGMRGGAALIAGGGAAIILGAYLLYFFRDPERQAPADPAAVVAGADGYIMSVTEVPEREFLKTDTVRISIFLTLFDVHVNRAPIAGKIAFLGYFPGKRFFTFQEKSSELNQHNSILIEGDGARCLVNQIVGPVARRVVYWLTPGQAVKKGDRIGMMKFGSRLDMYFPKGSVEVLINKGDRVRAGETVVARLQGSVAA